MIASLKVSIYLEINDAVQPPDAYCGLHVEVTDE